MCPISSSEYSKKIYLVEAKNHKRDQTGRSNTVHTGNRRDAWVCTLIWNTSLFACTQVVGETGLISLVIFWSGFVTEHGTFHILFCYCTLSSDIRGIYVSNDHEKQAIGTAFLHCQWKFDDTMKPTKTKTFWAILKRFRLVFVIGTILGSALNFYSNRYIYI